MLIQFHTLQNYVPSNLNRDDTGAPKDAMFGGYRRGRISSQCIKRSIRRSEAFKDAFEKDGMLGIRTRQLPELLRKELEALSVDPEDLQAILAPVAKFGRESGKKSAEDNVEEGDGKETEVETACKQLIFLGRSELRPMAENLWALYKKAGKIKWAKLESKDITKELGPSAPRSVDIAMFGRMTTSAAFEDVQAAVQVAHAISTNAIAQEFDYYTAMDDLKPDSEPGADMIGDVEFNSSTYYKYFNIHWEGLKANLGDDAEVARKAVLALLEAAAIAQPSGKQNTFAAQNLPDLILVEVSKKNLPVSYANAFIKPASKYGEKSLMDDSVAKLADYMRRVGKIFAIENTRAFTATQEYEFPDAKAQESLPAIQKWLAAQIAG
jgi:CRISPR system Cascade subunit CasC